MKTLIYATPAVKGLKTLLKKHFASSANKLIEQKETTSGTSFIFNKNKIGPKIESRGTPDVTDNQLDLAPYIATYPC